MSTTTQTVMDSVVQVLRELADSVQPDEHLEAQLRSSTNEDGGREVAIDVHLRQPEANDQTLSLQVTTAAGAPEAEAEPAAEAPADDRMRMRKDDLIAEAVAKGIKVPSKARKTDIIALLDSHQG